jgi:hypothetical protein
MDRTPITARFVAKRVAQAIVASQVSKFTRCKISDYTRFDNDDTIVEVGSDVVGWLVSEQLAPVTDKIVDKTTDFVATKRQQRKERKAKKNAEEK